MSGSVCAEDLRSAVPDSRGKVVVDGIRNRICIYRDTWGIPHIRAHTVEDAFFGQGFAHAQDRLWQMEYDRKRAAGRWAELAGQEGVDSDQLTRPMGLLDSARRDYASVNEETRRMVDAYSRGVNAFIQTTDSLPTEYQMVSAEPEPWAPWDCMAVYKVRHVMMGPWEQKLLRARLVNEIGAEKAALLFRGYVRGHPLILPPGATWSYDALADAVKKFQEGREAVQWLRTDQDGSNSWVVGGSRTDSGKPLLAGDPHRSLDVPNAYYQNHLAGPGFDVVGLSFAGVPGFPHFGHNEHVAWCITHTGADTQDLYVEKFSADEPQRYLYDGTWVASDTQWETLRVRDSEPIPIRIIRTHHGPVLIGGPDAGYGLAFKYTATAEVDSTFECLLPMMRSGNVGEIQEAVRRWVVPCNNMLVADRRGHFAYRTRGKIPLRSEENAWLPVPGWTGKHEWRGAIPFEEMPSAENPESDYIVTANNRVADDTYPYLIALEFSPGYRAQRIMDRITSREGLTVKDMEDVHGDIVSLPARELVSILESVPVRNAEDERARELLMEWDGSMHRDRVEPTLYCALRDAIVDLVMRRLLGPLSNEILSSGRGGARILTRLRAPLMGMLAAGDTRLLDHQDDWASVVAQALSKAVEDLRHHMGSDMEEWRWGAVHRTRPIHTLSPSFEDLSALLDPPGVDVHGDADVVHSASYIPTGTDFTVSGTSNARYVFDLGDWSRSRWIIPLGSSGHPGSNHYADQLPLWRNVETVKMLYRWDEIQSEAVTRQVLRPGRQAEEK